MDLQTLAKISDSLPERFPFYSFGEVSRGDETRFTGQLDVESKQAVSFRLLGDPAALLVVLFEEGVDVSMYCELGNILASKLCQKLSEGGEGDLMITPPLLLNEAQLRRLAHSNIPSIHRTYQHTYDNRTVLLETLILPIFTAGGDTGNA